MPWKLESKNKVLVKYFLPNTLYSVGRFESDLIVNDKSVSRSHATLIWSNSLSYILVTDLSRFGTFINKTTLSDKKGNLKDGDVITFGAQPGVDFNCSFVPFDIVTSTLVNSDKKLLRDYLSITGGNILSDWNVNVECLVMSQLKVTYKVVCALIKQVKIVKIDFIKEMVDYFQGIKSNLPNPDEYLPPINLTDLPKSEISFTANPIRKTLFKSKKFYFMTKEKMTKLEEAVKSAGGHAVLLTESNYKAPILDEHLKRPDNIVMYEVVENAVTKHIYSILKSINRRPVIDSEIGFAILLASTNEYCNPSKPCNKTIYSESGLSQVLSVNPFHIRVEDSIRDNVLVNSMKRPLEEDSADTSSPNVKRNRSTVVTSITSAARPIEIDLVKKTSKAIKSPSRNNLLQLKSNSNQSVNKEPSLQSVVENVSLDSYRDKENQVVNRNLMKKSPESIVNSNSSKQENFPNLQSKINQFLVLSKNPEEIDEDFDNISIPNYVPAPKKSKPIIEAIPKKSKNNCKSLQPILIEQIEPLKPSINKQICENTAIKMIPGELFKKSANNLESNKDTNGITRILNLVTATGHRYGNFKTFKKGCTVYLNSNPMKLIVFGK